MKIMINRIKLVKKIGNNSSNPIMLLDNQQKPSKIEFNQKTLWNLFTHLLLNPIYLVSHPNEWFYPRLKTPKKSFFVLNTSGGKWDWTQNSPLFRRSFSPFHESIII